MIEALFAARRQLVSVGAATGKNVADQDNLVLVVVLKADAPTAYPQTPLGIIAVKAPDIAAVGRCQPLQRA